MATTEQMLVKAEGELSEAKGELSEAKTAFAKFEGDKDEGKLLKAFRGISGRGGVLTADQRQLLVDLTAKEKRLEADVRDRTKHVEELQLRLTAPTQPGNDFVTRRWGRRVVCTWGRVDVVVWVLVMCCYCFTLID